MNKEPTAALHPNTQYEDIRNSLLTNFEKESGYKVIGVYIDEENTPVREHCFIRKGWIIERGRTVSKKHNYMKTQVFNLIFKHLHSQGLQHSNSYLALDNRLSVVQSSEPFNRDEVVPDLAVFNEPLLGDFGTIPSGKIPVLVIEILSESTERNDLIEKKAIYRALRVPNYWILAKSDDRNEGLEQSIFYKLRRNEYVDISESFQESGVLECLELFDLKLDASDVWFSEDGNHAVVQWARSQIRAEQEKQRAEQEKQRAEQEKLLRIDTEKKWRRVHDLLSHETNLTNEEKDELALLRKELLK